MRFKSAAELCAHEPRATTHFREGELRTLGEIIHEWAEGRLTGPDARAQFQEQILRGEDRAALGFQGVVGAASQAGSEGAAIGAAVGQAVARALSSAIVGDPEGNSGNPRSGHPGSANEAAVQVLGVFGAVAGGLLSGVHHAVIGGSRAALQSRRIFVFVDRVFLRATKGQAWELAAQQLELEGARPPIPVIERQFMGKLQGVLNGFERRLAERPEQRAPEPQEPQEPTTKQGVWLRLVQLCLSLELLRLLDAPEERVPLPREDFADTLRFDGHFLAQRVSELAEELREAFAAGRKGMSSSEVDARCPLVMPSASQCEDECPVCLEQFHPSLQVRRLPCAHLMHKECGDAWLKKAGTCPTCRFDLCA